MSESAKGQLAILCTALLWSTSGLFIKWIDWHPMVISCIRSAIAAVFMAAVNGKSMFAAITTARGMNKTIFEVLTLVSMNHFIIGVTWGGRAHGENAPQYLL